MMTTRRPHPRQRGFTLLEMLVVLVLLSLLMLGLGGALRTIGQAGARIDERLARSDDFRVATGFLRGVLGQVSGRKTLSAETPNGFVAFAGTAGALAWVGVMPARYGAGGRNFFRLGVEPVAGQPALVLRFVPWAEGPPGFPDWSRATARVLATGVTEFSVSYQDERELPAVWLASWPHLDRLPERVSLRIASEEGAWPALVVALRVMPRGGPNEGGFVLGAPEPGR